MTQHATKLGMNKTGKDMSPVDSRRLIDYAEQVKADPPESTNALTTIRGSFAAEASNLGAVPVPGTVQGMAATALQKLTGKKPELLVDKLGERLAFERTGVRLYEALIAKLKGLADQVDPAILRSVTRFRDEEGKHFQLLRKTMEGLGADPTAQTPAADATAIVSSGALQLISDPRSNLAQCLNALLTVELSDNAAWELLIQLARESEQNEMAEAFAEAQREEKQHVATVRDWLQNQLLTEIKA